MLLCIDTALEHCGTGLIRDGKMIDSLDSDTSMRASEILHQMISDLLKNNDADFKDLKAVAVNGGPGSYTGLRIGASAAKGLCYALDIPLIHIGCLELMTEAVIVREGMTGFDHYIPMIDARRDEVFTAVYDGARRTLLSPTPMVLEAASLENFRNGSCLFFGNGAAKAAKILGLPAESILHQFSLKMQDFERLAWEKWLVRDFEDTVHYTPGYLKKFHFIGPATA